MRIFVCDNNQDQLNTLLSMLMDCKYKQGCSLKSFRNPLELLADFEDGSEVDVIFLDILMTEISGIELAEKLRTFGYEGAIVFLSSANNFAVESYKVNALDYLIKPAKKPEIQSLLDKLEKARSSAKNSGFHLSSNDGGRFIKFADLIFMEVQNHHLFFHISGGEVIKIYGKLSDYSNALLMDSRMTRDNRSYIFNMDYIHRCEDGAVYLKGGTRISIPQRFSEFQSNYFKWMFGKKK